MSTSPFLISPYPARPSTPWKVEIRASFAGKKIRRFCGSEAEAWAVGEGLVDKIRTKGIGSLKEAPAGMRMKDACEAFTARQRSKSKSHSDKARQICRMLEAKFPLVTVSPPELDAWFMALPGTETTRAMFYRYIRMFFRWLNRMGYLERDPSGALDSPRAAVGRNILTVDQMKALLSVKMDNWMLASVLLAGFAGLRTEEILRMDWEDIDTKARQVHVRPGVMKDSGGFDQRIVDFTAPLTRRKDALTGKGKLVPVTSRKFHYARVDLAKTLEWPGWPDNCLRHSFATYHLAQSKNPGLTAFQMGHTSPGMVQRVYAVPARRADGAAWWKI